MDARPDLLLAGSDSCIQRGALSVPRKRFKEQRFHSVFFRDEKISGCLCRIAKEAVKKLRRIPRSARQIILESCRCTADRLGALRPLWRLRQAGDNKAKTLRRVCLGCISIALTRKVNYEAEQDYRADGSFQSLPVGAPLRHAVGSRAGR